MHCNSTIEQQMAMKPAQWRTHDNIKMSDGQNLILGHCKTLAPYGGRDDATKVSIIASASGSPLWDKSGIWGSPRILIQKM